MFVGSVTRITRKDAAMTGTFRESASLKKRLYEYCTENSIACTLLITKEILVEATGVEPASENVTGQETTCLFAFMPQSLGVAALPGTFAAHAQNGQETLAASLRS